MDDSKHVRMKLHALFPGQVRDLHPCWVEYAWSRVYRIILSDGTCMFLKGTPRSRKEALVTQRLHALHPTGIPRVIMPDLVPEAEWRWFLLEDAGYSDTTTMFSTTAKEAAYQLGVLQRRAMHDTVLPNVLVHCEDHHLQKRALDVCAWALMRAPVTTRESIEHIATGITQATPFFDEVADQLQNVPATIVHGDLWAGNIAVDSSHRTIRLVDWGMRCGVQVGSL